MYTIEQDSKVFICHMTPNSEIYTTLIW